MTELPDFGSLMDLYLVHEAMQRFYDKGKLSVRQQVKQRLRLMKELEEYANRK